MFHKKELIWRLSNRTLSVVPYVRGRLVFAEMAVRILRENSFDTVLIDLPRFMNQQQWLDAPLSSFPLVSSLLIQGKNGLCSLYPIVPTDAAYAAAWLARSRSLAFDCVDPVISIDPSDNILSIPIRELGDERLVLTKGPKYYFKTAWADLDVHWREAEGACMRSLVAHGEAIANRISHKTSSGAKVLFICEYRLWWAVHKALHAPVDSRTESLQNIRGRKTCSCALFLEDPYLLWAAGLFDDYLTINKRFYESLVSEGAASFAKYVSLAGLLAGCPSRRGMARLRHDTQNALAALVRSLKNQGKMKTGNSLSPARFLEEAQSCLGPEGGDVLARLLMDYPVPQSADAAKNPPEYFEIEDERIRPSDKWFDLPDVFHAIPYGEPSRSKTGNGADGSGQESWLHCIHPVISRQEAKALGEKTSDFRWAVERDYELHVQACSIVRQIAGRVGSVDLEDEELGTTTPVMFVFSNSSEKPQKLTIVCDNNLTRRQMELQGFEYIPAKDAPAPDFVYSVFATVGALESLFEAHIERELITSLCILFSGTGMGVERYTAIIQQPKRYQCRERPQDDPELSAFKACDLSLAWAIKYARKTAIAVHCPEWEPSQDLQRFARKRRKRILTLSIDVLPEDLANRLRQLHFISNALKLHPEHKRIVARFIK